MPKGRKQRTAVKTRTQYIKSGGKPLKWLPNITDTERPLSKVGSIRYIKATQEEEPTKEKAPNTVTMEKPTGSPATRNRYKLGGGDPLHWLKDIKQTTSPLTKETSIRYIKETGKSPKRSRILRNIKEVSQDEGSETIIAKPVTIAKSTRSPSPGENTRRGAKRKFNTPESKPDESDADDNEEENGTRLTRSSYINSGGKPLKWIKDIKEANKPLTNEGSIRYKKENPKNVKNKTKLQNKGKNNIDGIITRTVAHQIKDVQTTTRNRYKLSAAPTLKWMKNIAESDRPLSKSTSVRFKKEQLQEQSKTKKGNVKQTNIKAASKILTKSKTIKKAKKKPIISGRKTRNMHALAGEKPLRWLKNINETDKPLSKEDSRRFIKEQQKESLLPIKQYRKKVIRKRGNVKETKNTDKGSDEENVESNEENVENDESNEEIEESNEEIEEFNEENEESNEEIESIEENEESIEDIEEPNEEEVKAEVDSGQEEDVAMDDQSDEVEENTQDLQNDNEDCSTNLPEQREVNTDEEIDSELDATPILRRSSTRIMTPTTTTTSSTTTEDKQDLKRSSTKPYINSFEREKSTFDKNLQEVETESNVKSIRQNSGSSTKSFTEKQASFSNKTSDAKNNDLERQQSSDITPIERTSIQPPENVIELDTKEAEYKDDVIKNKSLKRTAVASDDEGYIPSSQSPKTVEKYDSFERSSSRKSSLKKSHDLPAYEEVLNVASMGTPEDQLNKSYSVDGIELCCEENLMSSAELAQYDERKQDDYSEIY